MKKKLQWPSFKDEAKVQEWLDTTDFSEYLEPSDFKRVSFPNLKPTSRSVSIRMPEWLLAQVKERANELLIPYQSLIKQYIQEGIKRS